MKILVYGAGAIGGYFGAKLSQHGHDVTLIVREATAVAINQAGLVVVEKGAEFVTRPTAVATLSQLFTDKTPHFDLIIMGMKAYDLASAADALTAVYPTAPMLMTIQNGIDIEAPLIDRFGAERVLSTAVTIPITKEAANRLVVHHDRRGLGLAPAQQGQEITRWLDLLRQVGLTVTPIPDYRAMKWSKALLNIMSNATCAILNRPPVFIYQSSSLFRLERRMVDEALAVMDKLGLSIVDLPGSPTKLLIFGLRWAPKLIMKPIFVNVIAKGRGDKMPSFYLDLVSGKGQSEVIFHNGAIARIARENGLTAPVNAKLTNLLLDLINGDLDPHQFDGNIPHLLEAVGSEQ